MQLTNLLLNCCSSFTQNHKTKRVEALGHEREKAERRFSCQRSCLRLRPRLWRGSSSQRGGGSPWASKKKTKKMGFWNGYFFYLGLERDLRENLEKRERRLTETEWVWVIWVWWSVAFLVAVGDMGSLGGGSWEREKEKREGERNEDRSEIEKERDKIVFWGLNW